MSMKFIRYQVDGEWEYANVKTVGDITTLKTQSKEDVVSAINSLFDENGKITDDILDQLEWIKDQNGEYIEKVENMAEIIEITDESLKHMNELTQQLERDQRAMEEMHSALLERQQEIIADLEKKIDKDKYDAEYNEIVSDLRDKVSSFDFANLTGKFTKMEKDFKNLEDEVSNKMSKTEFDDAVGVNKWTIDSYDVKDTDFTKTHASFEFIKEKTPEYSDEIDDSISLLIPKDVNRINHLFTNVKMNNAKTITLNIEFKNSVVVYMNGAILHRDYSTNSKRANVSLSLREGWNTIEILLGVSTVSPVLTMSTKLSDSVDKMTTTIGVGDKNESRLTHSETMWKQTQESIALKADKTVVSQIGNNVKDNSALLEVMSDEIKQTVKEKEFNEYTKRLTDAEAKIKVNSDAIEQTVRKTEFDKLNNEVKDNKTKIDQTAEKIEQTATSVEVIGEKADSLRDEFDNLEFGGRNYIVESKINSHVAYNTKPTYDNHILTTVKTDESNYITISVDGFIPENKYYTIHGYMKVDGEPVTNAMWGNKVATTIGMNLGDVEFYVDDETGYFEITQLWRGDSRWLLHTGMYNEIRGKTITIEEFMFEQSTKASDYTEAPENKDERLRLAETLISQNSKEILLKASQADLNKVTGDLKNAVAKIELNSEGIRQSVTKEEFEGLEYENRNLLGNSKKPELKTNNASTHPLKITEFDDYIRYEPQDGSGLSTYSSLNGIEHPIYDKDWLGKDMAVSITVRVSKDVKLRFRFSDWGMTPSTRIKEDFFDVKANDGWTTLKMPIPKELIVKNPDDDFIRFLLYTADDRNTNITPYDGAIDVKDWKIEFGLKVTPWSPAPEDVESRLSKAEATIETTVEGIKLLATKDEVNKKVNTTTYNSKMSSLDTTIKGINAKVESTETSVNGLTGEMESAKKRLTTVETTADGVKTSVTKLENSVGNLVKNPELTGSIDGWYELNGDGLTVESHTLVPFRDTKVLTSLVTNNNATIYSDWFEVDPSKAYEVSMWVNHAFSHGRWYLGVHGSDSATGTINNVGFSRVLKSNGSIDLENSTNFYFESKANNTSTSWTKITGYLMPTGTDPKTMKGIGENNQYNAIMNPKLKRVRVRWLNYSSSDFFNFMYVAQPKVVEVSSDTISYANAQFNVMADKIETKVSSVDFTGKKVASLISQDASSIKMIADEISFNGVVTIKDGVTSIANGKITSAMIKDLDAEKISVGTLRGINIYGVNINGSRFFSQFADSERIGFVEIDKGEIVSHSMDPNEMTTTTISYGTIINEGATKVSQSHGEYVNRKIEMNEGSITTYSDIRNSSLYNEELTIYENVIRSSNVLNIISDTESIFADGDLSVSKSLKAGNIAVGQVSVAGNPDGNSKVAVKFGKKFSKAPKVTVSPRTSVAGTTLKGVGIGSITTEGFEVNLRRSNTVTTVVHWIAISD